MTKVEVLKRLLCAIKNDGTTPEQISGSDVSEVLKNFIPYYGGDIGEFVPLNLKSEPAETSGTTYISVDVDVHNITPSSNFIIVYKTGAKLELPAYHELIKGSPEGSLRYGDGTSLLSLVGPSGSLWKYWDGESALSIDDGLQICVALINRSNRIIRAGITTVHSKVS